MGNKKNKQFVIQNQVSEISRLADQIEALAGEWNLSQELAMNINLVVEEAVTNIIFYAFNDKNEHKIKITVSKENNRLKLTIADDGIPFNPLEQQMPDINLPAEERPVGGLGIFLISQIMDEMNYARTKHENILTLHKNL